MYLIEITHPNLITYHKRNYVGLGQTTSRHKASAYSNEFKLVTIAANMADKYRELEFSVVNY